MALGSEESTRSETAARAGRGHFPSCRFVGSQHLHVYLCAPQDGLSPSLISALRPATRHVSATAYSCPPGLAALNFLWE